VSQNLLQWSS